jgi:hypothetical protein
MVTTLLAPPEVVAKQSTKRVFPPLKEMSTFVPELRQSSYAAVGENLDSRTTRVNMDCVS